jgi:hypothetical protein
MRLVLLLEVENSTGPQPRIAQPTVTDIVLPGQNNGQLQDTVQPGPFDDIVLPGQIEILF